MKHVDEFVERLVEEIRIRAESGQKKPVDTLYLGGGTPSVLSSGLLDRILGEIHRLFSFREEPEITMECNPDDLNREFLRELRKKGFNRLSIGIQSFDEDRLYLLRRSHSAQQAESSVKDAADAGFGNITIDLIYGIPGQSVSAWESNLRRALLLPVSHLSAYHLTFEPGTVFDHWRKLGRLVLPGEETSLQQYMKLTEIMKGSGFDHYEISNFSKEGKWSEHNLIYWSGGTYTGMGPSAHSYDGKTRSWNISSLKGYLEAIRLRKPFSETEVLTRRDRYHDYLITSLRTRRGIDPVYLQKHFGTDTLHHFQERSVPFLTDGTLIRTDSRIAIDPDHWMITDMILRDLFVEEDDPEKSS